MRLYIETDAWHKIQYYVDTCKTEVSGLGKIERRDGDFYVTDIRIFEQDVSGAHSDIEAEALAKFQVELIKDGENPVDWTLWWHSHANMGVFFSGTDVATIDESTDFRYMVSLVTNHNHELTARVDVYEPVRYHQALDVTLLLPEVPKTVAKSCQKEIDKHVKKTKTTVKQKDFGFKKPYWNEYDDYDGYGYLELEEEEKKTENQKWVDGLDDYLDMKAELELELGEARAQGNHAGVQVAQSELSELERLAVKEGYKAYD